MPIQSKQINKILAASVRVGSFSASGTSNTVTSPITTALATAGDGGVSVPVQASNSSGLGVVTTGTSNRVEIYDATTKDKILGIDGEEVYARLTESAGVYTLSYYTLPAGTETAYTLPSTSIDFEFTYRFDFHRYPTDSAIAVRARNIAEDPGSAGGQPYSEVLTVTATNTIANLAKTPVSASTTKLVVNGIEYDTFGGGSAAFSVNTSTKALTWSASNSGFSVETTDRVVVKYFTFE